MSHSAVDPVTGRWVGALWNLAAGKGAADAVMDDLGHLAHAFRSPAVSAFMLGGAVSMEDRRAKLQSLVGGFNSLTQRFVWLCLDRGRLEILPNAFNAFRARRMQEDGVLEGVVEAPRPLGEHDVHALENSLHSRLGKTVRLAQATTPDLVGGVRVTIGDKMIDASIAGRFDGLRRRLLEARLPSSAATD